MRSFVELQEPGGILYTHLWIYQLWLCNTYDESSGPLEWTIDTQLDNRTTLFPEMTDNTWAINDALKIGNAKCRRSLLSSLMTLLWRERYGCIHVSYSFMHLYSNFTAQPIVVTPLENAWRQKSWSNISKIYDIISSIAFNLVIDARENGHARVDLCTNIWKNSFQILNLRKIKHFIILISVIITRACKIERWTRSKNAMNLF